MVGVLGSSPSVDTKRALTTVVVLALFIYSSAMSHLLDDQRFVGVLHDRVKDVMQVGVALF